MIESKPTAFQSLQVMQPTALSPSSAHQLGLFVLKHRTRKTRIRRFCTFPRNRLVTCADPSISSTNIGEASSVKHPLMEALKSSLMSYAQNVALLSEATAKKLEEFAGKGGLEELKGFRFPHPSSILLAVALGCLIVIVIRKSLSIKGQQNLPPVVPGFPFVGNLLQMTTERPHRVLTSWSEKYGPIFVIRTGQVSQVIVSSPEIAKEALVTKYASISNRSVGTNITTLTRNKKIVAMADYGERYRMLKRMVMNNLLGQHPQKLLRPQREYYLHKSLDSLFDELKKFPGAAGEVNVRNFLRNVLFGLGMHQMFGRDVEKIGVPELGAELTSCQMFEVLVQDVMKGAVQIDWRDFFPSLSWIPNKKLENSLRQIESRRSAVIKALMEEQKKLLADKAKGDCYCDTILENSSQFTEDELLLAVWEPIIESSDTTLVTSEWAIYELASQPKLQERLYNEIKQVVGDRMVTEDDLPNLPFLNAVVKETLRKYSPVPIIPPRYVHEEVQLGGYTIPAGYQLIVNIFGVHHDKKRWKDPGVWDPSRLLGDEKLDLGVSDMRVMPFGGGKRICAGMTQAFYIVPMIIASLVQHFEWSLPPAGKDDVEDTVYLTTQKLLPLQAIAKPRVSHRISTMQPAVVH